MLRARLAVAAVGLPLIAAVVAAPESVFEPLITLVLAAAAFELFRAATRASSVQAESSPPGSSVEIGSSVPTGSPLPDSSSIPAQSSLPTGIAAAAAAALLVATARTVDDFTLWPFLLLLLFTLVVVLHPRIELRRPAVGWWILAVLYAGALGAHWILLRNGADGREWIIVMLAVTFATDSAAYGVGRTIGRHRLAPRLSPGKTWEGAIGGFGGGLAVGLALPPLLGLSPGAGTAAIVAVSLPVAAMGGDLLESALKRRIGTKEMSELLPGHGGLLDRLDSLLLTGPALYWILQWFNT